MRMLNNEYERRLLRQHAGNLASSGSLEARPFTAALPPSGGFPGSSSDLFHIMVTPAKKPHISVMPENPRCRSIGDRFIPARARNSWQTKFAMITEDGHSQLTKKTTENGNWNCDGSTYSCLLKNELLGAGIEDVKDQYDERGVLVPLDGRNLFQYTLPDRSGNGSGAETSSLASCSLLAVSTKSQKLLRSGRKMTQKISSKPFKVLCASELQDDFCLNLIDWSSQNVLSVGLGSCAYVWSASTKQATKLCNLSGDGNSVTSVAWNEKGNLLAVGTEFGTVQVWDVAAEKAIEKLRCRSRRVSALVWNRDIVSSGNNDGRILEYDMRTASLAAERRLVGHEGGVCGLKWSPCKQYLASGGIDHHVFVWDVRSLSPVQNYTEHSAAVKAIAWSPHRRGLLATGGGAADQCIHLWDSHTGQSLHRVDTGCQVTNVAWSKDSPELVSAHSDMQKQVAVWRYPGLTPLACLAGLTSGASYMAVSPDDEVIVTGGSGEILCFWNVFTRLRSQKENTSVLSLFTSMR